MLLCISISSNCPWLNVLLSVKLINNDLLSKVKKKKEEEEVRGG